jgi:hypothetical protein
MPTSGVSPTASRMSFASIAADYRSERRHDRPTDAWGMLGMGVSYAAPSL